MRSGGRRPSDLEKVVQGHRPADLLAGLGLGRRVEAGAAVGDVAGQMEHRLTLPVGDGHGKGLDVPVGIQGEVLGQPGIGVLPRLKGHDPAAVG